jgi:DNA-directed RNA polymerase subunit RPC12/RpoP
VRAHSAMTTSNTHSRDRITLEVKYRCAFCGSPMYHRGGFQPSINYAECWECWAKHVIAGRDKFRDSLNRWRAWAPVVVGVSFSLGYLSGWWFA